MSDLSVDPLMFEIILTVLLILLIDNDSILTSFEAYIVFTPNRSRSKW